MKGINDKNIWSLYISNTYIHTLKKTTAYTYFSSSDKILKGLQTIRLKTTVPM